MKAVESLLEKNFRKNLGIPTSVPREGLHGSIEEIGLDIPSIWENFFAARRSGIGRTFAMTKGP